MLTGGGISLREIEAERARKLQNVRSKRKEQPDNDVAEVKIVQKAMQSLIESVAAAFIEECSRYDEHRGDYYWDERIRDLEPDISEYNDLLSITSLMGQKRQDTDFWREAYAIAFASEQDLDPVGALHRGQIIAAVQSVAEAITHGHRNQSNIASFQQGKSGSGSAKHMFSPLIYWIVNGEKLHSFYLLNNDLGLETQIRREFHAKWAIFKHFGLSHPTLHPKVVKVADLFNQHLQPRWDDDLVNPNPALHIVRVTSAKAIKETFQQKIAALMDADKERCQFIIDESDAGTRKDGVIDGYIGEFVQDVLHKRRSNKLSFLLHSATPQEHVYAKNFFSLLEPQGKFYSGSPMHEGEPFPSLDPDYKVKPPLLERYTRYFGIKELDFRSYKNAMAWLRRIKGNQMTRDRRLTYWNRHKATLQPQWELYRAEFERDLAKMAMRLLSEKKVGNKEFPHARGILIRSIDKNHDLGSADELAEALNSHFEAAGEDINVLRFYGENSRVVAKDFIRQQCAPNERYVVLVTGGARRGDAFPRHCAFAIDLTQRPSTLVSALQGLFGRMCGWNKEGVFFGTDWMCGVIETYLKDGYAAASSLFTNIGRRVEVLDPLTARAARDNKLFKGELFYDHAFQYVLKHPDAKPVLAFFKGWEAILNRHRREGKVWKYTVALGSKGRGRGKAGVSLEDENNTEFLELFNRLKIASLLEKHPGLLSVDDEKKVFFDRADMLYYETDAVKRLQHESRGPSPDNRYISNAYNSRVMSYGGKVGRRVVPAWHPDGRPVKGRSNHGGTPTDRDGHRDKGDESADRHVLQLWWDCEAFEKDLLTPQPGKDLSIPRISLMLRRPHGIKDFTLPEKNRPYFPKDNSIYSPDMAVSL